MARTNRTDTYPDFPEFTVEERDRIDRYLKELEAKYGRVKIPFQITPHGSTQFSRSDLSKKLRDAEVAAGVRRVRKRRR